MKYGINFKLEIIERIIVRWSYGNTREPLFAVSHNSKLNNIVSGETVYHIGPHESKSMSVIPQRDNHFMIFSCKFMRNLNAFSTTTNREIWSKYEVTGYKKLNPLSVAVNEHGHLFVAGNHQIHMFHTDGRYMGNLLNLPGARFVQWNPRTSSLIVAQAKDIMANNTWYQKYVISTHNVNPGQEEEETSGLKLTTGGAAAAPSRLDKKAEALFTSEHSECESEYDTDFE